jgi:hypothetical protein
LLQIDDFTGDGIRDFASGDYSGNVYFHNIVNGNRMKTTLIQSMALILRLEDMGDVNKDGHPDLIVGHSGAKAVMIDGYDASILWQQPLADKSWNVTNMGDITWDGTNDAAVGTLYQDNRTYFFDGATGSTLYFAIGNTPVDALDAIPDIVGDNSMELVVGGRTGGVVCLSGGYDSTLISIPEKRFSAGNFAVIYPNPCEDVVHVALNLKKVSDVYLKVSDIRGQIVYSMQLKEVAAGTRVIDLNRGQFSSNIRNGVYILSVSNGDAVQHCKLIVR